MAVKEYTGFLIAPLSTLLLGGCTGASKPSPLGAREKLLAGVWVCAKEPRNSGFYFDQNRKGAFRGTDKTNPGQPLAWEVRKDGKLGIMLFGEEGEHGDFKYVSYEVKNGTLTLSEPIKGCIEFRQGK